MPAPEIEDIYPLSPTQAGMLFRARYDPPSLVHVERLSCSLRGRLDVSLFERTWQQVLARHAVLRTVFDWQELDEPVQVVLRRVSVPIELLDLRSAPPEEREARLREVESALGNRAFDLQRAPLARFALVRLEDDLHRFVWTHHHILMDGWSVALVAQEVFALYEALAEGRASPLAPPVPYRAFVAWLRTVDRAADERYWRRRLAGVTPDVPPSSARAPAAAAESYEELALRLSEEESARLVGFARGHGLTASTLLQAAWALVQSRQTGRRTVVFGVTVSGRPPELPGVEAAVGMFMNTLPARVDVAPGAPLLDWLRDLGRAQVEMERHAHAPLADLQRWAGASPDRPLFDTLLVFENYPRATSLERQGGDVAVEDVRSREWTGYPLTILAVPGSRMSVTFVYDPSAYPVDSVRRTAHRLRAALHAIARSPGSRLGDLAVLGPVERHALEVEWNDTAARFPDGLLHETVAERAALAPDAIAAVFEDDHLTYAALDRRSDALARRLVAAGVRPDEVVGVLLERSLELPVVLLAVLESGAAYLPLEPSHPPEYLSREIEDAGVRIVVSIADLAERAPWLRTRWILLDDDSARPRGTSGRLPRVDEDAAAYVLYTSGSTGRPKGVVVPHRGIRNRLAWMQEAYSLGAGDRVLQKTPLSFDVSVWELFWPLTTGACLVLAPPGAHLEPQRIAALVDRHAITVLHFVPSMLQAFLDHTSSRLAGVRHVVSSGEALSGELARRFFERTDAELSNLYGPTEASIDVTVARCERDAGTGGVPLGRPIANLRTLVLDEALHPAPIGVPGELAIGGVGLARGYANRADLTAERFVPSPAGDAPGARCYLTGDRVRTRPDGVLEFLGRLDHQVKVRGVRIELGAIESVLRRHPAVREAAVVVRQDGAADPTLVAYVTPTVPREGASEDALRRHVLASLPRSMVPGAFVALDSFPLTATGKLDRRALVAAPPPRASDPAGGARTAGSSGTQELLAGIWRRILGVSEIRTGDSFFALGGHSLLALQMVSRVRQVFGVEIPLRVVFDAPSLGDVTRAVEDALRPVPDGVPADGPPVAADALSPSEERLWFADQMSPGDPAYHVISATRIEGRLDPQALVRSVNEVVRRHEALRTSFPLRDGRPTRRVAPRLSIDVPVVDLAQVPSEERVDTARRIAEETARRAFSLEAGPLLRACLIRLAALDHVAVFAVHHAVFDGWSAGVFQRELSALYAAHAAGAPSPLPELSARYVDVLPRSPGRTGALVARWKRKLDGALPPAEVPPDRPRRDSPGSRASSVPVTLPADTVASVRRLCCARDGTLFMVLVAVFQAVLRHRTRSDRVVVGTDVALRDRPDAENHIGCFLNQLVLDADFTRAATFGELLTRVRTSTIEAYAVRELPFEQLVAAHNPARDLGRSPLFQAKIVLQNAGSGTLDLPGLGVSAWPLAVDTSEFDFLLEVRERPEGDLRGTLRYRSDLFFEDTAAALAAMFEAGLGMVATDPDVSLDDLDDRFRAVHRERALRTRREREAESRRRLGGALRSR